VAALSANSSLLLNHVYAKTGTYSVTVTATDANGNTSAVATQSINVVQVAVEKDPFNPSLTALFVGGTSGNDSVNFSQGKNSIAVTLNGVSEGVFSTSGPLIVFGQGGIDTIGEAGVTSPTYLIESLNTDNIEADLDQQALQWAGISAAIEILSA